MSAIGKKKKTEEKRLEGQLAILNNCSWNRPQ